MNAPAVTPTYQDVAVELIDGRVWITSMQIAQHFGKLHKTILRAISLMDCSPEFHRHNFVPLLREVPVNNGAVRQMPIFNITRDGFTFLAMGFTGHRAAQWKEAYIAAFNAMEANLLIEADIASQPPSVVNRRWLVTVDHDGNESFIPVCNTACVVTQDTLPAMVRQCFPEFVLLRRDALLGAEAI